MTYSVLIIDNHPVVREGIKAILTASGDLAVTGECDNIADAHRLLGELKPDIAIVDLSLEGRSGIEVVSQIKCNWPDTRSLVMSGFDERVYAVRAMKAGASGYITKAASSEAIVDACLKVGRGKMAYSESVVIQLVQRDNSRGGEPESVLTNRELEVFSLMGRGMSPQDIADCLSISLKTVYKHIANIKEQLGLTQGTSLTHFATAWIIENRARRARAIRA